MDGEHGHCFLSGESVLERQMTLIIRLDGTKQRNRYEPDMSSVIRVGVRNEDTQRLHVFDS